MALTEGQRKVVEKADRARKAVKRSRLAAHRKRNGRAWEILNGKV